MVKGKPARGRLPLPAPSDLSERELEVASLVVAGLTYKQIGDRLFISPKTIEHHVARMRQRLGCDSRADLLVRLKELVADR
jgi:DNA-binding CsgD family transcriptional regulator